MEIPIEIYILIKVNLPLNNFFYDRNSLQKR